MPEKLCQPVRTSADTDGASWDLYTLYLNGYGAGGKASVTGVEFVADFFTLGIANHMLAAHHAMRVGLESNSRSFSSQPHSG